jgi:tRNA(Ile)-lysidine synthetase-like protein
MAHSKRGVVSSLESALVRGGRYLVAVSGGVDSIVLLHALNSISKNKSLQFGVVHVNHGLRAESSADATFVKTAAENFAVPFFLMTLVPPLQGTNIEAWGREARYQFFREVVSTAPYDAVLTAHHADDVAETLLIKLFANKELSTIDDVGFNGQVVRPLLKVSRATIEQYAEEHSLQFVNDSSNQSPAFARNRIRNTIMPLLRTEFGSRVGEALARRAESLDDDHKALQELARENAERMVRLQFGSPQWLSELNSLLKSLPKAIAWRVIEHLLLPELGYSLGRFHSEQVFDFLSKNSVRVELGNGRSLIRENSGISLTNTTS